MCIYTNELMPHQQNEITGVVEQFNISPKGVYESLLLTTPKGTVQVNFPPEAGSNVSSLIAEGAKASFFVEEEEDERPSHHEVFRLIRFTGTNHQILKVEVEAEPVKVKGVVSRINFARHGEPNGAILDSGDFIHMKPQGAKAVGLEPGMQLTVEGEARRSFVSARVIEAAVVNGTEMHPAATNPATKKKHAHAKHAAKRKKP